LWWLDATVADVHAALASEDARRRGYFLGALLREANSRDVWLFTNPDAIRRDWEWIPPHLGRSRKMWGWLLGMSAEWPPAAATGVGGRFALIRDAGGHVRGKLIVDDIEVEVDAVHEALPDLEAPPAAVEGVIVESLPDLRAAKLTCLLSRREPRDLVDVLFLERAGFRPEADLELALRKDAGIDPAILAWLIAEFPTEPLPEMLKPLTQDEFERYRNELAQRFRALALKT
jgi:hypothetical protein